MTSLRLRVAAGVLAVTLLVHASAMAGIENAGTTAANFLSLGAGTRTLAMGGATLGLGDDAASAGWHAAALGWVEGMEAALSHAGLPNSSLQEWGSLGGRLLYQMVNLNSVSQGFIQTMTVRWSTIAMSAGIAIVVAVFSTLIPAYSASRLPIAVAVRRRGE